MNKKKLFSEKYKSLINIVRILGSVSLLILATLELDWAKFGQVFIEINPWYLLAMPLLYILNVTLSVLRWQVILSQWNIKPGTWKLWRIYLISSFWGNFLPSTIGGDGYRFLALQSCPNASKTKIFSSLLLDRLYGFVSLSIIHFIVVIFYWRELQKSTFLVRIELAIFAIAFILVVIWLIAGSFVRVRNFKTPLSKWLASVINKITEIFILIKQQNWRISAFGGGFSILFVGTIAIAWKIYYLAAGVQVDGVIAMYATSLIGILGVLPITLNGIGVMELCQVTILNWQGLPIEKAILAVFLTRIMSVILTLPGGVLYLFDSFKKTPVRTN